MLVEVAGRPVIALPGETPAYRDLRPGAVGDDVAQLQWGLNELGYSLPEVDGVFGEGTKQAVTRFYQDRGYQPATTGDELEVEAADTAVIQLERQVEDARKAWQEAEGDHEEDAARTLLDRAEEDLRRAEGRRSEVRALTGPMLPLSEFVFLPSFPSWVLSLNVRVGAWVDTPLLGLASGELVVRASASVAQRELLRPDLRAEIVPDSGEPVPGVVTSIDAEQEVGDAAGGYVITAVPEAPLDGALVGRGARVAVEVVSSGDEVMAVPVSGLYAAPDSSVYVIAIDAGGRQRTVIVLPELGGDGYVAVRPVDGDLAPGDRVVVGARPAAAGDGAT